MNHDGNIKIKLSRKDWILQRKGFLEFKSNLSYFQDCLNFKSLFKNLCQFFNVDLFPRRYGTSKIRYGTSKIRYGMSNSLLSYLKIIFQLIT